VNNALPQKALRCAKDGGREPERESAMRSLAQRSKFTRPSMTDGLSTLDQDLLSGSYDCVDRIVLNGYFQWSLPG
jgi:hypothetical protein